MKKAKRRCWYPHGTKKITIGGVRIYESMIEHILHKTSIPISGKLLDFYSDEKNMFYNNKDL